MVDIHSHILHGLDDGASTFEESLEMVRMARAAGTTDIVATPHANSEFPYQPEIIEQRIAELNAALGSDIRIHRGCDFHLMFDTIQDALAHPHKYTINGMAYLLVEFSDFAIFSSTDDVFTRLRGHGIIPIITHPERNALLIEKLDHIARWIQQGCYVQVTASSLLGQFGKRARSFAEELMNHQMIHFIASDAHDCQHRPPVLQESYEHVRRKWGEQAARLLFVDNPAVVVSGQREVVTPAVGKKWFKLFANRSPEA